MRTRFTIVVASVGAVLLTIAAVAMASGSATPNAQGPSGASIEVIEHAISDTVIDTGAPGDSTGDLLTFSNPLYDATDTNVIGHDQGSCIRIDPAKGSWECTWTNFLPGGKITVEGPFFDNAGSKLAITGGTRSNRSAQGVMSLRAGASGEYRFKFRVILDPNYP
jgi:allene oxide cyclase